MTELRFGRRPLPLKQIPVAVRILNAETGKQRLTLSGYPSTVDQVAFSPDGKLLASAGYRLVKDLESVDRRELLREFKEGELRSGTDDVLVFSKSGRLLATAGEQTVQLWDVATRRSVAFSRGTHC